MANIIVQRKSSFYPVIESSEIERIADDIIDEVMPIFMNKKIFIFLSKQKCCLCRTLTMCSETIKARKT